MEINNLVYLVAILFVLYFVFSQTKDALENTSEQPQTIFAMENAYTNIHCVREDLPLIKLRPNSIACLSKDGSKCFSRSDLQVPADYACNDSQKSVNNYLSKDGIRDKSKYSRTMFDDLMSGGYHNIECDYSALHDSNHWCGKVYQAVQDRCATKSEIERMSDRLCNKDLFTYYNTKRTDNPTNSTFYSPTSIQSRIEKCVTTDCKRQVNIDQPYCEESCKLCYDATCNGERPHKKITPPSTPAAAPNLGARGRRA
ncbi:MAG: hypothetical protein EBU90_04095 [Proteobacteria bacterium]|nr:hypothetical protein [Pseudomonadota bacterium]NBP13926.1 hypothetical protein [bacterium]